MAWRYIAGESLPEALRLVDGLQRTGLLATVDVLGENVAREEDARSAVSEYDALIDGLSDRGPRTEVSVKPTLVGLRISEDLATANLARVAEHASRRGVGLAVDMEDSTATDATLRIYRTLRERWPAVGLALQAYLRRSPRDLEELLPLRPAVRVCKGIYIEPSEVAIQDRQGIRDSFLQLVERLLAGGGFAAIATHDPWLVDRCLALTRRLDPSGTSHEFQMLLGVGESLRPRILASKSRIRIYCPYGPSWHAYSLRRLKENPKLVGYVVKSLLTLERATRPA